MKRPIPACSGLFLCASLLAQGSMTTPPGGLAIEGVSSSYVMGAWPDLHIQQADDVHSNGKPKTITEIAFRLNYQDHTSRSATGRTWTNIALEMSEPTNFESMSSIFSNNVGTSPTRVFDSKWSWPTRTGTPPLKPDVWGGIKGQLRFPFTKPWVYSAKGSILADYTFRGGTLANNSAWGLTEARYQLDSELLTTIARGSTGHLVPRVPLQCNDSAITLTTPAYTWGSATAHGHGDSVTSLRGKLAFNHSSYYTAPYAPVVQALGTPAKGGVNVGAGCNDLHIDFNQPVLLVSAKAQVPDGYSGRLGFATPWQNEFASMIVGVQTAWTDSKTKAFKLTAAVEVTLPDSLPIAAPLRLKTVLATDSKSTFGVGPFSSGPWNTYFPSTRYKIQ